MLDKELIDRNLELKEPVPFIDNNIVLSTGKKPKMKIKSMHPFLDLSFEEQKEYEHELNRSLSKRINESIRRNNDNI